MKFGNVAKLAVAGMVAMGLGAMTNVASAGSHKGVEKCAGVAKKGMNDCGTSTHSCAGQAKTDGHPQEWVALPKGTCKKLVNGKTVK